MGYMFRCKGQIIEPEASMQEDKMLEAALNAGAEDVSTVGENPIVTTTHDQFPALGSAVRNAGFAPIPRNSQISGHHVSD
jgi:transcriptional/translational regulatory protein YebC/TACO1